MDAASRQAELIPRRVTGAELPLAAAARPPRATLSSRRIQRPAPVRLRADLPTRPLAPRRRVGRSTTRLDVPVRRPATRSRQDRLPAGWPLKYLLIGFPIWWACGLSTLIFPLMALPMALELLRRARTTRITVPPGFWLWALFLAWQVIGLLLIGVSPPGTHPGSSTGRVVSLGFSALEYAGVTITLLYVGNLRPSEVPQSAIARWMGAFFLTVLAGGFLGLVAPRFSFQSAVEVVLPRDIADQRFVHSLVHPVAAQVQNVIGVDLGRPSAPFGYTNSWGNAISILLVWFVAAWVIPARGPRRALYLAIVAASVVPVVLSLNRGLWIGLGATVLWVLGRQLLRGRLGPVLLVLAGGALATAAAALTPLASVISARLQHGDSNAIRAFVDHLSLVAIRFSPIVGYGGTRHANGSASSVAIGPTPSCSTCGDVATGSTGQLWSVLFNQGLVGALLYFGFFAVALWTYRRRRGAINEAALVTVVLVFVYMFFYSAVPVAPTLTMIAVGVLWREDASRGRPAAP